MFYGQLNEPGSPPPTAPDLFTLLAVYSLMAYLIMALIRRYRVDGVLSLLVVGALYGWFTEGMIVATAYENLPFSLSFTGLAWHMPLDVVIGWYGMQFLLRKSRLRTVLAASLGLGLFWGFWAVWPWYNGVQPLNPAAFTGFSLIVTGLLILAYWVNGKVGLDTFEPRRSGLITAGAILLLWYTINTAFVYPVFLFLLPVLFGICFWALRKHSRTATAPDVLASLQGKPKLRNLAGLLVFPVMAILEYSLIAATGWRVPSNVIVYLLLTPGGFVLFGWSVWKLLRNKRL